MKGSLKPCGCHIHLWFDKCECSFIYFDMVYLIHNKRATLYQHHSWAVCSGKARKPHPWLPTFSKVGEIFIFPYGKDVIQFTLHPCLM